MWDPAPGSRQPPVSVQAGDEGIENSPVEKYLRVDKKLDVS